MHQILRDVQLIQIEHHQHIFCEEPLYFALILFKPFYFTKQYEKYLP